MDEVAVGATAGAAADLDPALLLLLLLLLPMLFSRSALLSAALPSGLDEAALMATTVYYCRASVCVCVCVVTLCMLEQSSRSDSQRVHSVSLASALSRLSCQEMRQIASFFPYYCQQ